MSSHADPRPREDPLKRGNDSQTLATLRARYHITPREIQALKQLSLSGTFSRSVISWLF